MHFFPKADAAPLPPSRESWSPGPTAIDPIFDGDNFASPIEPWTLSAASCCYPSNTDESPYAPAPIPDETTSPAASYLRPQLAQNERLRLSMVWYYGAGLRDEPDLLLGLREKAYHARESAGWEFAVVGILDVNVYIRLATAGLPLGVLPRGETLCAHTATQPPGNVFLLPNMLEDWRFRQSPYVEQGGLVAYAGVPLRIQHESGETIGLGTICVASSTPQPPLTKNQQRSLTRLADWVVADLVQSTRTRRQRERHRFAELIATLENTTDDIHESVLRILKVAYPDEIISIQACRPGEQYKNGSFSGLQTELQNGLWEDAAYIDEFISTSNHSEPPRDRVVRFISAPCESKPGHCVLAVATKDFRRIFDDVDAWFIKTCASVLTQTWHKRLLTEAIRVKENFIRGISHQLRTPIHGILGAAELLAEEAQIANAGKASLYLDTISIAGRELMSTVNSMIMVNRWTEIALSARQYNVYDVGDLEMELIKELAEVTINYKTSQASVFFQNKLPRDKSNLRTDMSLLRSSVLPLIVNAIQNTTEGVITVTFSAPPNSTELWVDIEDSGCGIHPDDQGRIFQLYEKIGEHSTRAGLGLTLATKYSTLLQGSISLVSSQLNQGSHFRAAFQDVVCADPARPSLPTISSLESLPLRFRQLGEETPLLSSLANFLTNNGLTQSEDFEDCFSILHHSGHSDQTDSLLSSVPENQIAICLVAKPADLKTVKQLPNIIYVSGPFSTSKLFTALQEVNRSIELIKRGSPSTSAEDVLSLSTTLAEVDLSTRCTASDDTRSTAEDSRMSSFGSSSTAAADETDRGRSLSSESVPDSMTPASELSDSSLSSTESLVPSRSDKPLVLVVDDNVINLRLLEMYCKNRGLAYLSAINGKQALDIFSSHQASSSVAAGQPSIELVFMDLQMPVCDGLDATQQIRSLEKQHGWPASVVFMVTGQDSQGDREAASAVGADDYLVKPVGLKLLDSKVREFFPAF